MFINKTKYKYIKFKLFKTFIMNKTNSDSKRNILFTHDYEYI